MNLTPEEEQHWRRRLRQEERRLSQRFQTEQNLIDDEVSRQVEPDDAPGWASREGNKDFMLNLEEGQRREFRAIADAWQRLDQGTFGVCANCGEEIPRERLEAIPYTSLCVKCSSEAH
jgi:RNA polymerase-binding protein DksA